MSYQRVSILSPWKTLVPVKWQDVSCFTPLICARYRDMEPISHLLCLSSGLRPSEEHLKANYVTTPHEVCPSLKAPPDAASAPCFWRLQSFVASHIPRFFARPKKKRERGKMATSCGVECHWSSGDATRKCSKGETVPFNNGWRC